jgi:glycosyltransferase involved in cell wall biosynthesis
MGGFRLTNPIIKVLTFLEVYLYKHAKKIVVLLPNAQEYIVPLGIGAKKIEWIPNGVNIYDHSHIQIKEKNSESFKIIYLGAHGKANALKVILEAAKIIYDSKYDIEFIFIGDGPEKNSLIKHKEKFNLQNAKFYKPVPKNEVPAILKTADALIISMQPISIYKYGFSYNKLFDYMAASKPIILAGNPANNLVTLAECGISVPAAAPQLLADAMIKLYNMPLEGREKMGQRGREYFEKYHSIPVLVDKLEKVINEVSNGKGRNEVD